MNHLIGKPFIDGGRGPEGYDCYGVLRAVYSEHGVELPEINVSVYAAKLAQGVIDLEAASRWEKIDSPEVPCAVLMRGSQGFADHIGVWIGGGKIIHTQINQGVIVQRRHDLKNRIKGFYRYVGNDHIYA